MLNLRKLNNSYMTSATRKYYSINLNSSPYNVSTEWR